MGGQWVEAVAHPRAMKETIINFMFELFIRYGLPQELVTNRGSQVTTHKISTTLQNYHVKQKVTSPYHPKANGKVERINKVLEAILTITVSPNHRDWASKSPYGPIGQPGAILLAIHLISSFSIRKPFFQLISNLRLSRLPTKSNWTS